MCAPKVMQAVRETLSRRDLIKLAAATSAAAAVASVPARAQAPALGTSISVTNLADLTHTLSPDFPVFPAFEPMEITNLFNVEEHGFYANRWHLGEHSGTHLDAPAHFIADAITADDIALENLIAPLAVIDISERAAADPDAMVLLEDLEAWEAEHGTLPDGAAVMMYSGWGERVGNPDLFINMDGDGVLHFPGFSPEAAEFLINNRNIKGIGVDTLSLDPGMAQSFDVHVTVLGAGKWGLENVANLNTIPAAGAYLIVGNLKVEDASGGPVRLMAAWE